MIKLPQEPKVYHRQVIWRSWLQTLPSFIACGGDRVGAFQLPGREVSFLKFSCWGDSFMVVLHWKYEIALWRGCGCPVGEKFVGIANWFAGVWGVTTVLQSINDMILSPLHCRLQNNLFWAVYWWLNFTTSNVRAQRQIITYFINCCRLLY